MIQSVRTLLIFFISMMTVNFSNAQSISAANVNELAKKEDSLKVFSDLMINAPEAPERFRAGHRQLVKTVGEAGESSRRMGTARVVMGQRRIGEELPIEASISQVVEHGQGV